MTQGIKFAQLCQFYIAIALVAAFVRADEEPFSIGLGVLSPSYSQTVGKENVKVNFEQKDNGFSYSVGDPNSGTNTYLNFGSAATSGQAINPSGYADANPSGYAGPNPSAGYGAPSAGYASPSSGYAGPSSGYAGPSSGYAGPSSGYAGPSSGYAGLSSGYAGPSASAGYGAGPQASPAFSSFAGGYQAPPSYGGVSSGLGAAGYGSQSSFGGSAGLAGAPSSGYVGESARKPEETPSQILPAGFSYHATEGQSFLRQDSPNFAIAQEPQESGRGLAEQSFHSNLRQSGGAQGSSGKFLVNGLVGYGAGGPRGNLPVGGYAGPQFAGLVREHGGHTSQDA